MKNIHYLLPVFLILINSGCKKFLDENPKGLVYGTSALSSVGGLDAALTGAYKGMASGSQQSFLFASVMAVTMGGDDVTTHPASNKADFREMDQFNATNTNQRSGGIWNACYKTIQGANNVINNYSQTVAVTATDKATVTRIRGEAHFLRGLAYFWLVRLWGNIPLITTSDFSFDLFKVEKSPVADVYQLIISDFSEAEKLLPTTKFQPGRPSIGSAKAYLAEVYLTMAGWPLMDVSKYALAAEKAKEVIDGKALYKFDLAADLATVWANDPAHVNIPEEVFSFYANTAGGNSTGNANYGFTAMPADEEGGFDDSYAEINFFYNFPEGRRKDLTFRTVLKRNNGTLVPWEESTTKHPYYQKNYLVNDQKLQRSSLPLVMMRYAHVLLMYAEAQARSTNAPNQQAYDALNAIRKRAGLPEYTFGSLSATQFADAVVNERSWEFAGERTRWFDLVRLELVESANANKNPNDLKPIGTIDKSDYWLKIPAQDLNINPNLR